MHGWGSAMSAEGSDLLFNLLLIPPLGIASVAVLLLSLFLLFLRQRGSAADYSKPVKLNGEHAVVPAKAEALAKPRCLLLYGTQTGTAERFAKQLKSDLQMRYGSDSSFDVVDAEEYRAEEHLAKERLVFFLLATYGDGEPTDNAADFYHWAVKAAQEAERGEGEQLLKVRPACWDDALGIIEPAVNV